MYLTASDVDLPEGATLSFSTDADVTGLTLNSDGSYDSLSDGETLSIEVPVTVTGEVGGEASTTLTIQVTGTNDLPVATAEEAAVTEDTSIAGQMTATDVDLPDGASLSFNTDASVEGLTLNADGSYEFDASSYDSLSDGEALAIEVPVTVSDEAGGEASTTLAITVTGTNDLPTAITLSGTSVDEGSAAATVVANLSAVDVDATDTFSYEIVGGPDLFEVVGDQILVKEGADLDFESADSHGLTLRVTDSSGGSYEQVITINVQDVNEAPADISFSGTEVVEGAVEGTVVATLQTTDQDSGETFSYELVRDASGHFEIVGNQLVVKAGADIDYETQAAHEISVKVTDSAGNTYTESVNIQVTDVQEVMRTTLDGTDRHDTITGTSDDELIRGFGSHDELSGGGGDDQIIGGEGHDTLMGGAGNDELEGGEGHDTLQGGEGDDILRGGAGKDVLEGGAGDDTLYAGDVKDTLRGGAGDDTLVAGGGNDWITRKVNNRIV